MVVHALNILAIRARILNSFGFQIFEHLAGADEWQNTKQRLGAVVVVRTVLKPISSEVVRRLLYLDGLQE